MLKKEGAMKGWLDYLDEEDLNFMRRFVLSSGSLKDLASVYGVSYPTIRLRLDRLIEKIKVAQNDRVASEFERTLRLQLAQGKLDSATFKTLMDAHSADLRQKGELS
jgi:hypothetical protein